MSKFLPFVHHVLGGEHMTNMNFNGCLFSLPGAKEQLWHIDGEHLFTSEESFELSGKQDVEFFHDAGQVRSILPAHPASHRCNLFTQLTIERFSRCQLLSENISLG